MLRPVVNFWMQPMDAASPKPAYDYWKQQIENALLAPVRAMRLAYLPLLMVYFAYGATGLTAVAQAFWVKEALVWTPAELASLAVWFSLPWTVKMVFGELVDTVPLLGSQRRTYVFLGAALVAISFVLLAGAAGGWITVLSADKLYVVAMLLATLGVVIQDVVADAMSTEVVPRTNPDGSPRAKAEIDHDLGMVQVLGRLALGFGIFAVAGASGWLASWVSYSTVFLCGLIVPLVSISGALLVRLETSERRPTDWRILGGGLAFGAFVIALALSGIGFSQEIIFVVSMAVIIWMLERVTREVEHATRMRIAFAAIIIFAFRATPGVGEGYRWFTIDALGFDEAFYGILQQIGAVIGIVGAWLLSDLITRKPVSQVLLWLTIIGTVLALPTLMLVFRLDLVTQQLFGIGARGIALFDAAATSPLDQLGMIPLLTLIALYAPASHRATWFALMASLMNLALTAGSLGTKYLNLVFHVDRGSYDNLPSLVVTAYVLAFVLPITAILLLGRRVR
jgi:MFS family permease